MRSSTFLSALFVAGTLSSPLVQKRDYVTEVDVVTVVDYVTEGFAAPAAATTTASGAQFYQVPASSSAAPTTTEAPAPAAPTSEAPAPPPASSSAPAAAPAPAPVQNVPAAGDYQSKILYHHNIHRANHSADALSWDPTLASYAQQVAASCNFVHNTQVGGGGYGQNLDSGQDAEHIGVSITDRLYNREMPLYTNNFGKDSPDMSNFHEWGHFSQIVWKTTTTVGCATQFCPNGMPGYPDVKSFTVCNYSPPGNYAGEYHNVGDPLGHPSVSAQ